MALEAHRLGNTTTVVVLFAGPKVPNYVKYGSMLMRCGLYRQHYDICRQWGQLLDEATDAGFCLLNDPAAYTRIGTSAQRDTNPDLTFHKPTPNLPPAQWRNTEETLGSDHCILEILVPLRYGGRRPYAPQNTHAVTEWSEFRAKLEEYAEGDTAENDIETWTQRTIEARKGATTSIETDEHLPQVGSHLAHMLQAKQSLQRRWRAQKHNRKLRKRIALLNIAIDRHSAAFSRQQWNAVCQQADGQLHKGRTHLLDESKSKGTQRHSLHRTLHKAIKDQGEAELRKSLDARYLPSTPRTPLSDYTGADNPQLDADIEEWEIRSVLQTLNCSSAAGPDRVTNKELRNLPDTTIAALAKHYNACWRSGTLPKAWKTAKTVLIPKPGKLPHTDNLRPISLTSCVGKVLEHGLINRWKRYLEDNELYPHTMIGFREKLSTQDAMLLLKRDILDRPPGCRDTCAVLGLDLQSAFDKIHHKAILEQVSALHMGTRAFVYIKDFLTERTVTIHAGDIELAPKTLGSEGTPQGSAISPLLFNLVMIRVATALHTVPDIRHTIYADDITICTRGGSDGQTKNALQQAIEAVEFSLEGPGLKCSPAKSELLILPPGPNRKDGNAAANIALHTRDGGSIPQVSKIRVLGMHIEAHKATDSQSTSSSPRSPRPRS
ncbi:uncharacterized protein LOC144168397 [Haemaphysalis longicornis]